MRRGKNILKSRGGTTLVELMVCAALLSILLATLSAMIGPFTNTFLEMRNLNYAQSITDTVLDTLRGEVLDAQGYVKVYAPAGEGKFPGEGAATLDKGVAVEFQNRDGYAVLVDAGGCGPTVILKNKETTGSEYTFPPGYLLMRYYRTDTQEGKASYEYSKGGRLAARGVSQVYGQRFYMGQTMEVSFQLPKGTRWGDRVSYLEATVTLYREGKEVYHDTAVLDMVFRPKAIEEKTAVMGREGTPEKP